MFDSAKFDLIHNSHLRIDGLKDLYKVAKELADCVIPCEYGTNPNMRYRIGSGIARNLVEKILKDLMNTREESIEDLRADRCKFLYGLSCSLSITFSSRSQELPRRIIFSC